MDAASCWEVMELGELVSRRAFLEVMVPLGLLLLLLVRYNYFTDRGLIVVEANRL